MKDLVDFTSESMTIEEKHLYLRDFSLEEETGNSIKKLIELSFCMHGSVMPHSAKDKICEEMIAILQDLQRFYE